jgi:hypothetical protein
MVAKPKRLGSDMIFKLMSFESNMFIILIF